MADRRAIGYAPRAPQARPPRRERRAKPRGYNRYTLWAFALLLALMGLNFGVQAIRDSFVSNTALPLAQAPRAFMIPVQGVRVGQLRDTWGEARAGGRTHQGIDIMAESGTPVRAVVDGRITRLGDDRLGGVSISQTAAQGRATFYYAHLLRYADGLAEDQEVRQGDVIGFVGETGNATTPHLHFEVRLKQDDDGRAEPVNPYPYLLSGEAPN